MTPTPRTTERRMAIVMVVVAATATLSAAATVLALSYQGARAEGLSLTVTTAILANVAAGALFISANGRGSGYSWRHALGVAVLCVITGHLGHRADGGLGFALAVVGTLLVVVVPEVCGVEIAEARRTKRTENGQ